MKRYNFWMALVAAIVQAMVLPMLLSAHQCFYFCVIFVFLVFNLLVMTASFHTLKDKDYEP